jgi:2-dehydro-3-deoxyphosphooctonate aldolase (KDO 8-P synthase)
MEQSLVELLGLERSPLFLIAGPCVIESADVCLTVARHVKDVCERLGITYIFKASFDKANRSSNGSFRGPGLEDGLVVLKRVKDELGLPVLSDVHETGQVAEAATVLDILQVPAFLARQTDLLIACARTGKAVNVKKGQFMAPAEMGNAVDKIRAAGNDRVLLTERGTFFGYNRLVNDFTGLPIMKSFGCPVVFDVTHSTQQPAGMGNQSGGNPQYAPLLARAADPKNAKSDAATMLGLEAVEAILRQVVAVRNAIVNYEL